jgi:hypothetical protein
MFARFSQIPDLNDREDPLVEGLEVVVVVAVSVDISEFNPLMADSLGDRFRA